MPTPRGTDVLASFLFEVAGLYARFYEACPVLKAEEPARNSRLALCRVTGRVLETGLGVLGIEIPPQM